MGVLLVCDSEEASPTAQFTDSGDKTTVSCFRLWVMPSTAYYFIECCVCVCVCVCVHYSKSSDQMGDSY